MKYLSYLLLLLSLLFAEGSLSQDIISLKDGSSLNVKVVEIGTEEVKYKKSNSPNGPLYVINKGDINKIVYPDGQEDIIDKDFLKQQDSQLDSILKKHEYALTNGRGWQSLKSAKYDELYSSKGGATDFGWQHTNTHITGFGRKTETSVSIIIKSINGSYMLSRTPNASSSISKISEPIIKTDTSHLYSHFFGLFTLLYENKKAISYVGLTSENGKSQYYFRIKMDKGYCEIWLDNQTFLPVSFKNNALRIDVLSSQSIKGFWFPSSLKGVAGDQTLSIQYSNFKINEDFKSEFKSAQQLDLEINEAKKTLLPKRRELSVDDFLYFNDGNTIDDIIVYLKEKNIHYEKESLNDETILLRIGQNKDAKIALKELPDLDYDYIVFAFWKKNLILIKFKYSIVGATETQYINTVVPIYKERCIKMDATIAQKLSKKPADIKTWSKKKHTFNILSRSEPSFSIHVQYWTEKLMGTQNLVFKSNKISTQGSEEYF